MGEPAHWLDRLMVRTTRRDALKALLATAAVVSLPLRPGPSMQARASESLCQKGCLYFYGWTAFSAEWDACTAAGLSAANEQDLATVLLATAYGGPLGVFFAAAQVIPPAHSSAVRIDASCRDQAIFDSKAHSWDCLQPGCPGFDPKAKGPAPGPCATCHDSCCPDPAVANGYSCCLMCHSAGGCCYSVNGSC